MITKIYAAYGSNMNIEQMSYRCPKSKVIGTGKLEDYKLTFRGNSRGVANIEKQAGGSVPIVLWKITKECEKALDVYEGYPRLYKKRDIEVITEKGETLKAMAYVMADKYESFPAIPTDYYYDVIKTGYADNKINLKPLQVAYSECLSKLRLVR